MSDPVRRVRMFAGPNGSGKSTLNGLLRPDLFGVHVNVDDIERQVRETGGVLDLRAYGVHAYEDEALLAFSNSRLLDAAGLADVAREHLHFWGGRLDFRDVPFNAYFAATAADLIRRSRPTTRRSTSRACDSGSCAAGIRCPRTRS